MTWQSCIQKCLPVCCAAAAWNTLWALCVHLGFFRISRSFFPTSICGSFSECKESTVTLTCATNLGIWGSSGRRDQAKLSLKYIIPWLLFPVEYWNLAGNIGPALIVVTGLEFKIASWGFFTCVPPEQWMTSAMWVTGCFILQRCILCAQLNAPGSASARMPDLKNIFGVRGLN